MLEALVEGAVQASRSGSDRYIDGDGWDVGHSSSVWGRCGTGCSLLFAAVVRVAVISACAVAAAAVISARALACAEAAADSWPPTEAVSPLRLSVTVARFAALAEAVDMRPMVRAVMSDATAWTVAVIAESSRPIMAVIICDSDRAESPRRDMKHERVRQPGRLSGLGCRRWVEHAMDQGRCAKVYAFGVEESVDILPHGPPTCLPPG